jgi:hypothetical protein
MTAHSRAQQCAMLIINLQDYIDDIRKELTFCSTKQMTIPDSSERGDCIVFAVTVNNVP